jgi:hypothetical protein
MTPDQHRAEAEGLLEESRTYSPAHPMRADILARAQVHALLALGPEPVTYTVEINAPAGGGGIGLLESLDRGLAQSASGDVASLGSFAEYAETEPEKPKPTPRKRTARKTTTTKETSK